jgi:FkbM family methyltransferase
MLKRVVKSVVLKAFSPLAARLGYTRNGGSASDKNNLLDTFYSTLIAINFKPRHIVDVGANHGSWTREALRYFPDARYTLLEPQFWLQRSIQDVLDTNPRVTFHAVGAGAQAGTFKFTIVDSDDSCTFRITEESARTQGFRQIDVPVVTLNDFFGRTDWPAPDIIKIDAEGIDLEVLQGASAFFGRTEIFMVEAGVVQKNFDNSIQKVVAYMDAHGYRLFDITDLNRPWSTRVLWLVELAFIKRTGFIDSQSFV